MDLLNCGYADIEMLDILYSKLAEEVGIDSASILKDAVTSFDGDFNSVITRAYSDITNAVADRLRNLIDEYVNTLENHQPTEVTRNSDLQYILDEYLYTDEETEDHDMVMKPLTEEQIDTIYEKIEEMEDSYPFANFLDSHFQNDLDQTLDEDDGIDDNCKALIEYWLYK